MSSSQRLLQSMTLIICEMLQLCIYLPGALHGGRGVCPPVYTTKLGTARYVVCESSVTLKLGVFLVVGIQRCQEAETKTVTQHSLLDYTIINSRPRVEFLLG